MKTAHTPGPWTHAITAGHHDFVVYSEADTRGHDIALVRDTDSEATANARLIAKAPELLDALRVMVDFYEQSIALARLAERDPFVTFGTKYEAAHAIARELLKGVES